MLQANGFSVDIASPLGGDAPRVLDDDDMAEFDYAFLNDATAMQKARNTIKLADVNPEDYQAIYFQLEQKLKINLRLIESIYTWC